jgi:hypothetical protein
VDTRVSLEISFVLGPANTGKNIVVLRINYVDVAIGFELFFRVHRQRSDSLMFADISMAAPAAGVLLVDTTAFR